MAEIHYPQQIRRRIWPWLALAGVLVATAGVIVLVFVLNGTSATGDRTPFGTALQKANDKCAAGTLGDKNHTLVIDMAGEEAGTGDASYSDVTCVLKELSAPDSLVARMGETRALDGMQSGTWEGFEASWTYHPDNGLDLIITQK